MQIKQAKPQPTGAPPAETAAKTPDCAPTPAPKIAVKAPEAVNLGPILAVVKPSVKLVAKILVSKAKPVQPASSPAPTPQSEIRAPAPIQKPETKSPAGSQTERFQEITLKVPESPAHVKLAPQVKMQRPSAAGPAATAKTPRDAREAPDSRVAPGNTDEPLAPPHGVASVSATVESKPAEPVPPAPQPVKTPISAPASQIAEINRSAEVFKFYCRVCQQKLAAKIDWQGKTIRCPACKNAIEIPSL